MVKQMIVVLLVSILIGAVGARGVAEVANGYFHSTLDSLVGSYGEYDFIVQVQEEKREEAKERLEKVLDDAFGKGTYQEAPVLGGRANFFVAIPAEKKTKELYERIDSYFAVLPGAAGLSIISEPRISIRGVPSGAVDPLVKELERIDGVRFAFRDGSTIQVMMTDMLQSRAAEEEIERLLELYRVIEVRFASGAEPPSPVRLGETLARRLEQSGAKQARYVSIDEERGNEAQMMATMKQMRDFLHRYRSRVTITLDEGVTLDHGEQVQVAGSERTVVRIEERKERQASGVIVVGDASSAEQGAVVYRLTGDGVSERVGTAYIEAPRARVIEMTEKLAQIASALPKDKAVSAETFSGLKAALAEWETARPRLLRSAKQLDEMNRISSEGTGQGMAADMAKLRGELTKATASLDNTRRWLNLAAWVSPEIRDARSSLTEVAERMTSLERYLEAMEDKTSEMARIRELTDAAANLTASFAREDNTAITRSLEMAEQILSGAEQSDLPTLALYLETAAKTLPNLRDDDMTESIRMIDRLTEGYLLPNKKIQLLVGQGYNEEAAETVIYETIGHDDVSVSEGALGIIEPNTYLEVYRMLSEVKRILAGLIAVLMTGLFLTLDHTAVISMIKLQSGKRDDRRYVRSIPASIYGALVGAVMLTSIFLLAGGGIPYVPIAVVPMIGALLGLVTVLYSERISPVSEGEVMAGESLGMTGCEILREIVIPSARPGLSQWINRHNLRFK